MSDSSNVPQSAPRTKPQAESIRNCVISVLAEQLGTPEAEINDVTTLARLGADSLDRVEFVMALEEEFGIEIPDAAAEDLDPKPIGAWVKYLEKRTAEGRR